MLSGALYIVFFRRTDRNTDCLYLRQMRPPTVLPIKGLANSYQSYINRSKKLVKHLSIYKIISLVGNYLFRIFNLFLQTNV